MTVKKTSDEREAILIESFEGLSLSTTNKDDLVKDVIRKVTSLLAQNDIESKRLLPRSPGGSSFTHSQQNRPQDLLTYADGAVYFSANGQVFPLEIQMTNEQCLAVANSEEFKRFIEDQYKICSHTQTVTKREPRRDSYDSGISSPDAKEKVENLKKSLDPQIKAMHWIKAVSMELDELFSLDCNNKSSLHYAIESKIDCKEMFYCIFTRMKKYPEYFKQFFTDNLRDSINAALQKHKLYDLLDFFEDGFSNC